MDAMTPRAVLDHVVASIGPASKAQAAGAHQRLAARPGGAGGGLEQLAIRLAAARHSPHPRLERRALILCAADHGVADPGVDLGDGAPAVVAMRHIAGGTAALNAAARAAAARLVLVDCGVRGGEQHPLGAGIIPFRVGDGTADITAGPAMTPVDAVIAVQTGIALLTSIADEGIDLIALGQLGPGSQPVTGALIAALTGEPAQSFGADAAAITAAQAANPSPGGEPLELLSLFGGFELGVLAGIILAAAAIDLPIVLDDHGTWAAALVAARLAPPAAEYLFAAHPGGSPGHRAALTALGLSPIFELGLAHGEGTGAVLALPVLDAAAGLLV
jgi:nicotinate-nucleotide--dimethylbenzimidazole phosphoribosyltransferase